jgi:hypothetical protein
MLSLFYSAHRPTISSQSKIILNISNEESIFWKSRSKLEKIINTNISLKVL